MAVNNPGPTPSDPAPAHLDTGRRLAKAERRAQILDVAREMYRTQSYDEISIKGVAERAGISHGLIYHYFPSKEALFLAAVEEGIAELLLRISPGIGDDAPWPEAALLSTGRYFDFAEENSRVFLNIFQGPVAGMSELQTLCETCRATIVDALLSGFVARCPPLPATRLFLRAAQGYVESCATTWLQRRDVPRAEVEVACTLQMGLAVLLGLRVDLPPDHPVRQEVEAQEPAFRESLERVAQPTSNPGKK